MIYSEIHIWGDSQARGILFDEARGRYAISRESSVKRLQRLAGCKVENHSVMGATVLDGLNAFERFAPVEDALCAVAFGGNDCDLNWSYVAEHPQEPIAAKVPLKEYTDGLTTFVNRIRQGGMVPLLVTPPPLHAPRYFDWVTRGINKEGVLTALGDVEHIYRWQERYTVAMRQVAAGMGCELMDVRDGFLALTHYERYLCMDGIHPNDEGYRVIGDLVLKEAIRKGRVPFPEARGRAV